MAMLLRRSEKGRSVPATNIVVLLLALICISCTRGQADVAFVHKGHTFTFSQVLEGAPGLIAGNFKHAEFLTEDSQGLIRKLSSFDEVGLNEEWLYIKGILQHWGEPDDRENSLLLYYVSGHYDPNIPAREQNLAYVDEVAGEIHELAAWRNGESLEPESAQRFVFGEIPLYGTYDEIRRVLGRPSAFVPDARWVPEMPSMVQWNFLIGDAPRRIVVVVCVAFREARVRRTVVNIAYEELR